MSDSLHSNQDPFYVTTPIYYVNDVPHIGHAYTTLAADTLSRWNALCGRSSFFLTGTDEHGLKIEQAARKAGITPQEHADRYAQPFKELTQTLDVHNHDFIRTTEARHQSVVQEMWRRMEEAGDIYLSTYSGWYSVSDEAYFTEDELVDGKAPSGHEVVWMEEQSYFFRLSKYTDRLLAHFESHPHFVQPQSRANEILRFIEQGLQDISISRTSFSWGVPVVGDDQHVTYVWVDALTNYISALGGPEGELYQKYWPSAVHLIGKDILRFHAVYWPCFLMSAGLPLPQCIFAHGWWTVDGAKMSKSMGNTVDPFEAVALLGPDRFRYFLLREISFGSDGDFSQTSLLARTNSELGNDYGNLLSRTLGMLKKYRNSSVPTSHRPQSQGWSEHEEKVYQVYQKSRTQLVDAMNAFKFHEALQAIWRLIGAGNKYVNDTTPWVLAKNEAHADLDRVLYTACEILRIVGIWTLPFLPQKSKELLESLKIDDHLQNFAATAHWGSWEGGLQVASGLNLFPRLEGPLTLTPRSKKLQQASQDESSNGSTTKKQKASKSASTEGQSSSKKKQEKKQKATQNEASSSEMIEYEDFTRLQLRVALVKEAQPHPNADRLLKLTLDAGEEELRTVCAGIAEAYKPEELVGKRVALLANLKPRKIRGILSQGMILAAVEGAQLCLVDVPQDLPVGTSIR